MDNLFTVFFIDDEFDDFLSLFVNLGNQKSINIIPFNSVEKGIKAIRDAGGCDGIILDLAFPEGKKQGKDGLKIIQKEFPGLPVIILTASYESEDIKTAVECIKMGALHYIGKVSLNPVALIEQLRMACSAYLNKRIDVQKLNFRRERKRFSEIQILNADTYQSFAFKLEHVSEPTPSKLINYQEEAISWHKTFFQIISFSYLQNANVELIYKKISSENLIQVYLIFTVQGNDTHTRDNITHLYNDVVSLFIPSKSEDNQIYFFSRLTSEEISKLKAASLLFQNKTSFEQQFVSFNLPAQLGFNTSDNNNPSLEIPIINFPDTDEVNSFLQLFSRLEINGELSILFQPRLLEYKEKKLLGFIAQKKIVAKTDNSSNSEYAVKNARLLYENHLSLFKCNMVLRSRDKALASHNKFRMGISSSFDKSPYSNYDKTKTTKGAIKFNYYCPSDAMASFRLPFPEAGGIPGIQSLNINTVRLPEIFTVEGIKLGVKNRLGEIIPINVSPDDLRQHIYVMGQTGTGKSTLLKSIINSLVQLKSGFFLLDPHGDLAREVQDIIKGNPEAESKLIFLNPSDPKSDVKLNFLEYDLRFPEQKSLVVNELFKIFEGLYDMRSAGGPMFEQFFKYGMLALLAEETVEKRGFPTFDEFHNFYFNTNFRNQILENIKDGTIKQFFENAKKMDGEQSFENFAPYITSKLNRIADDFYLSRFVNTKESNLNLRELIDEGKILIVNLDKGKLGSENVTLFGQLLVNKLNLAAMSRGELPKSERNDFYVIIDEFQNFSRGDIGGSLSELRKYGIIMILANQSIWQLERGIADSVLGNVGNLIFFRPGVRDYELLKYYLEPEFKREDVLKLGNFNCIARLMTRNIPAEPFIFQTEPTG